MTKPMTDEERANPSPRVLKSREQARAWIAANPERAKANKLAYRASHPEVGKAHAKAYYQANKAKRNEAAKEWRAANPEKVKAGTDAWREANPERYKAFKLAWRKANTESVKKSNQIYRKANTEKVKATSLAWREANSQRVRENKRLSKHHRRANMLKLPNFTISKKDVLRLLRGPCAVTDCSNADIQIDHAIPISRGGSHGIGNLQSLCAWHNNSKNAKTWMEYRVYLGLVT